MDPVFYVVAGKGAFWIVDNYGTVFGDSLDRDLADVYCEKLNDKWARNKGHFEGMRMTNQTEEKL